MFEPSPRELVSRTLRFEPVPRVPRQVWMLPVAKHEHPEDALALARDFPDDIVSPPFDPPPVACVRGDRYSPGTCVDEWGCEFVNLAPGIIGEVKDPLLKSYESDLGKVRPPYEWVNAGLEGVNEACARSDRFMLAAPGINPFERMQWIRGTESLFVDLIERPPGLAKLRDLVHEWNLAMIDGWARTEVDGIGWSDDWGTQRAMLIDPALWRDFFKPLYRQYVERIHAAGKFAFMHSDGWILDIYEDLIEIGVNAINSQLFCMDIEEIGRRFKGRITFWGEIDRQHILPYASVEEVRQAVRRVARSLYDGHGGVIAQCEYGAGAKPENVRAVFDEWDRISGRTTAATRRP
jgi:uroporphyrinogen decarboxylase